MYSLEEFKKLSSKKKENQVYGPSKDDVLYQKYLEGKPQKSWRDEAIERLTPKALTPPTQAGPTYLEKLAENREKAKQLSARVPETATAASNIREMIFGKPIEAGTVNPRISAADFSTRYDSMTDREKAAYTYLKNTDAKKADEYLKAIEMDINARNAEKRVADAKKIAEDSTAAGLYERFMGNNVVSNGAATAYELWKGLRNQPVDPNHPLLAGQDIVKGQNEAFVGDSTGIERYLREGAMGAFDFGTNIALGGATGLKGQALQNMVKGSFAAQAFAGSAQDAAEREGTGMQSVMTGTASAALATIIEGIGLERLMEIGRMANARGILKSMAKSIVPEGLEEGVEEAGNILADAVIMGDKNEIVGLYNTARANGATQNDAMMAVIGQAGKQIGESAIIGGISGGLIGGGVAMTNRAFGGNVLENDVPDTNVGETEQLNTETTQNPVTSHETSISDELTNSSPATETLPTEAQRMSEQEARAAESRKSALDKFFYKNGQDAFEEEFQKTGKVDHFNAFRTYYNAGLSGVKISDIRQTVFTEVANKDMLLKAYEAGAMDRKADLEARATNTSKLPRLSGVYGETSVLNSGKRLYTEAMAEAFGVRVKVERTLKQNGFYDPNERQITVAADAETYSGTISHEVGHFIRDIVPENFSEISGMIMTQLNKMDGKSVDQRLYEYDLKLNYDEDGNRTDAYDNDALMEEMVCDGLQAVVMSEEDARELFSKMEQQSPGLLQKLKDFLTDLLNKLRGLIENEQYKEIALDLKKDEEFVRQLRDKVVEAAIAVKEKDAQTRTAEPKKQPAEQTSGVKFSKKMSFADQVDAVLDDSVDFTNSHVYVMETPKVLTDLGLRKLPMLMTAKHVYTAARADGKYNKKKVHYHDLGSNLLKQIPDAMRNPVAIMESNSRDDSIVVVLELIDNKNRPVIVSVLYDGSGNYGEIEIDSNVITSAYGRNNFFGFMEEAKKEDRMLYFDKEKSQLLNKTPGVQFPDNLDEVDFSSNVTRFKQKINSKRVTNSDTEAVGVQIDEATQSAAPKKFSRRTWEGSDYVTERNKAAKEMSEKLSITQKKAKAYIDAVNGVAKMIADNPNILDYESNEFASAFVSNSEYGGSIDFSTICKKRRWMTGTLSAIQRALPHTALTAEEVLDIRNRMKEKGYEVSCGLCYVEGSRTKMGEFTSKFIELYKRDNPPYVPTMAEMNTPEGLAKMMKEHPEVYDAYEYFYNHYGKLKPDDKALFASQQKPKLYQLATEYKGEVLEKFKDDEGVELKNKNGGLRLQSFSDFEVIHLIDAMQVITDMARVGLAGQAYTKVPDFAWALGDTGLKINLSLIAKGVDENGNIVLDEVEGMPKKDAETLRNRYSDNVGTIIVVFNDDQLYAAMKDDFIDFIIPFHRSQWKKAQYPAMGLPAKVKDYTYQQNEKLIKKTYHEWRGKMVLDKPTNYMPNEYWDFTKSGKENAENYLQMCAENNKRPKFYKLLKNNGDGSYSLQDDGSTDGYWKLLIDFKMYNNEGKGVPQGAVKPEFNMDEAYRMLQEYGGDHSQFPAAQDVVDEFVAEKQGEGFYGDNKKYSVRVTDKKTLDFLNNQKTITTYKTMQMVDGKLYPPMAARVNGEYEDYSVLGQWEESVEHPELVDEKGEFKLDKGKGEGSLKARYNPYMHSSNIVLNDQFKGAYARPQLVTVECEVPSSELTSGYHAEKAKDPVGWHPWKAGEVATKVRKAKGLERRVFLSRWIKPVRIVPDTEVAQMYKGYLEGTDIAVPDNVVTPSLLAELKKAGVKIDESGKVKHSVRESGEAELRRENASLISENKHLQKLNENLKKQFKLTDGKNPDPKEVKRVAKDWLKQIQSKADVEDFSMKLGKITEYFAKAEDKNDHDHALAALRVLVREAMEEAETLNTEMRDSYSDLISRIKDTTLKVTEAVREELEYYGGYNSFRREHFSSMTLNSQNGASIDSFYNELCSDYAEFFKEEDATTEGEQLMRISEVLDALKPVAENPYGYYIDEYVYDETMGLLDKMADIQMEQTFADKKKAEKTAAMQKLKAEFRTTMDAMRNEVKAAQEEAEKAYVSGRMVEGRNKAKEIARLEAKHLRLKERNKKAADNRKARADRRIIEKEAKAMLEWLANPTDTKHVPEALKKHTAYLLTMFTTGKDDRLTNLQLVVSKLAEEYRKLDPDDKRNEDMTGRYIEYDDNLTLIAEALDESLKKRTDGLISLNNLTAEEMGDLKDMIRMLKKTLMEANKLVTMDKRAEVSNVSEDIIADMQPRKNAVQTGKLRVLNDFFKLDMLDANSFFKRMSNTAYATIYRSFRKGLDTKIRCVKEAADFMNELVDKKTVKQWRDTAPEKIELMGGTVYLNIPQIMSVYCLSRREQGKQHLYTGGVVGDTDYKKKRLSKETLEAMKQVTGSQLTEADVKQITDRLTAEQKHVAREMQRFLSENAAKWGNDVTMQLFGYKKFNEQNYFPIKVDGDTTMVTVGKPKDATRSLRSLGMTKQLKKNAQNPVMARDIFTVFAEHIDQMSSYAAFVPAISDTNKILNYKTEGGASVKKELRRVMGDGGIGYIHKLVDMINGAVAYSNDGAFAKAMVRNMKIASVGFNARVVVQQPTSIVRASVVIKPQYILASAIPTKKDWENIYRYAPISWWKEQGYYDVNIGKSIEGLMTGSTGMEKVTDASMWAAGKADKITWGWIWKAAEKQIRAEQPGLTGDAFYEAVGELFSRAIDETQVVDSPLHRSQKMREKGLFTQITTSFMSEPTKTYNMATTAMMNLMRENTPENRKQFARTLWWLTASAAATAAAAAVVDAGRDDDDDEKWADKWLAAFRGDYSEAETKGDMAKAFFGSNFGSNVNPMNYIPYMKDLMSIFDGYDIRRTDMDWAVDIKNAMNRLHKYAEGDSEYTAYATFTYVAGAFSKVFGVPMKSIMRDMEAVVNWANIHLIGTEEAKYENSRRNLAVGSKKNMSYYTERYLKAYQNGDKALAQKIYNDMINGGVDEEELKQKIASNVNDMMFDAHVMGNDSEFRKFWNEQNGRGKEDSSLRTSMRSRYETMYKNAVKNGDSEAQREAKAGFMEFGGKETTLDKYH